MYNAEDIYVFILINIERFDQFLNFLGEMDSEKTTASWEYCVLFSLIFHYTCVVLHTSFLSMSLVLSNISPRARLQFQQTGCLHNSMLLKPKKGRRKS